MTPRPFSVFGYLLVCSAALFLSYLSIVDPVGSRTLLKEDNWVENLTAISLFLAGVLLFATAWMERNSVRCCVYILGGMAMVFVTGEELDWGQRIIGFATPDFLLDVNNDKMTIHNIPRVSRIILYIGIISTTLLCTATLAAFFCGKDELFGIPLPSIFLVLCFLTVILCSRKASPYSRYDDVYYFVRYLFELPLRVENVLLTLLLFFTLLCKKAEFFVATLAVLVFSYAHAYTGARSDIYNIYPYSEEEIMESLFSLSCFFYAAELFCRSRIMDGASRRPGTPFHSREEKSDGRVAFASSLPVNVRSSMINGICTLIIAGSIGLAALGGPGTATAFFEKQYSRIKAAEPIIRSEFDVHLVENQLIYSKTPCAPPDSRRQLFLHVVPTDTNALPMVRRKYGFDNLDHDVIVRRDGTHAGGRCLSIVPLPDYDIVSITTGRFTGTVRSWEETFRFIP